MEDLKCNEPTLGCTIAFGILGCMIKGVENTFSKHIHCGFFYAIFVHLNVVRIVWKRDNYEQGQVKTRN